ncbi:MAG: hypothetical protein GXZ11_06720 [Tissierellia bacterium]|nr:hypothetical protein [Tissierellia bacterium]
MAQKFVESIGFSIYIVLMMGMAYYIINNSKGRLSTKLLGLSGLAITLSQGAEMVSRIFSLMTKGIVDSLSPIGLGRKWMWIGIFIVGVLLYEMVKSRSKSRPNGNLDKLIYALALFGIVISLFRFNQWDALFPPKGIGFLRLLPMIIIYGLLALIFYSNGKSKRDAMLMKMSIALIIIIITSFINTLWGGSVVVFNIWQIIRTLATVYLLFLPYNEVRHENLLSRF